MNLKNAFGLKLYEIKDLFLESSVENNIHITLKSVLAHLGIFSDQSENIINECLSLAKKIRSSYDYEIKAHAVLKNAGITQEIPKKLLGRSKLIYNQIISNLIDGSVMDLGCGDGKVSELINKEGYQIVLSDVYENPNIKNTGLEFRLFGQSDNVPASENEFDNSLALTVLHHSNDPIKVLKELCRITKNGGRVLVIESIYGVDGSQLSTDQRQKLKSFLSLNMEQQRMVNIFFDHFYNRLISYSDKLSTKANIPFNFNTPDGWKKIFEVNGFKQEKVIHLGVDQPIVPEYHTLHILRVDK